MFAVRIRLWIWEGYVHGERNSRTRLNGLVQSHSHLLTCTCTIRRGAAGHAVAGEQIPLAEAALPFRLTPSGWARVLLYSRMVT